MSFCSAATISVVNGSLGISDKCFEDAYLIFLYVLFIDLTDVV